MLHMLPVCASGKVFSNRKKRFGFLERELSLIMGILARTVHLSPAKAVRMTNLVSQLKQDIGGRSLPEVGGRGRGREMPTTSAILTGSVNLRATARVPARRRC